MVLNRQEKLRKKLTTTNPETLFSDLAKESSSLFNQLEKTVKYGESTTTLVVGMAGSGKSCLINNTLSKIKEKYPENRPTLIHLDGNVEIDDRRSVISIASQIGVSTTLEAEGLDEDDCNEITPLQQELSSTKLYDAMHTVLTALKEGTAGNRVIIILDRFVKFAQRSMQTLLYNLLDQARHSDKISLALICISSKPDVDVLLEKRVKSRFASRKTITLSRCWNLIDLKNYIKHALTLDDDLLWNDEVDQLVNSKFWDDCIKNYNYHLNTPRDISRLLLTAVLITPEKNSLTTHFIQEAMNMIGDVGRSDETRLLANLSDIQFLSAIACCRASDQNPGKPINFMLVNQIIADAGMTLGYSMKIHLRAFQQNVESGLLISIKQANNCGMYEYQKFTPMVQYQDLKDVLCFVGNNKFNQEIRRFLK